MGGEFSLQLREGGGGAGGGGVRVGGELCAGGGELGEDFVDLGEGLGEVGFFDEPVVVFLDGFHRCGVGEVWCGEVWWVRLVVVVVRVVGSWIVDDDGRLIAYLLYLFKNIAL